MGTNPTNEPMVLPVSRCLLSAYDLTCRSAYDLVCRCSGELMSSPTGW